MEKTLSKFSAIAAIGEYFSLLFEVLKTSIYRPPALSLIFRQLFDVGVASLFVVLITGFATGLVLAAQSFYQLEHTGLTSVTGLLVAKALLIEMGPVLTAFMVTGRVGASMCAEIGTMRVTEQIDALLTMSIHPLNYIVAPRMLAGTIMMPLLTIFNVFTGIYGGYLISVLYFHMAPMNFIEPIEAGISYFDLTIPFVKGIIFGIVAMSIACFMGLRTTGGAAGVGRYTTISVVITYITILLVNFLLTMVLNDVNDAFFHPSTSGLG